MRTIDRYIRFLKTYINNYSDFFAIYIREENFEELLKVYPYELNDKQFSLGLIKYLIKKNSKKIEDNFSERNSIFIKILKIDNTIETKTITKKEFLSLVEDAYNCGFLSEEEYYKISKIRENSSFEQFQKDIAEVVYIYSGPTIQSVSINLNSLVEILLLSPKELYEAIEKNPFGLNKSEFIHCVYSIFEEPINGLAGINFNMVRSRKLRLFDKYYFPKQLVDNVDVLLKKVDITSFEEAITLEPEYIDDIHVNDELWNKIINKVPKDFNKLEQAYYIYYQLCKIFTYHLNYFVLGESSKEIGISVVRKFRFLSSYNEENNGVVCFEIMAIYQKFLKYLGLDFDVYDGECRGSDVIYSRHSNVNMAIDDMLITIDATKSVISGDMPLAKENRPLKGFICINKNEITQERFRESLEKVHKYIYENEKQESSFFDVVNAYRKFLDEEELFDLSDSEKISIVINSITQTDLSETDSLVYISELTRILFPNGNLKNYFVLEHREGERIPGIAVILAYSDETNANRETNGYFIYSKNSGLEYKTLEDLQKAFDMKYYEYMKRYKRSIPNIKEKDTEEDNKNGYTI